MNPILDNAYSPQYFREQGHALIDLLSDYLESVETRQEDIPLPYHRPEEALNFWQKDLEKPLISDASKLFETVLNRSIHLHHPRVMGHQVPPPAPMAALAGLVSNVLNNGMAVYEMGMTANGMERVVTDWMAKHLGFDGNANGLVTSGGTLANLTAMLTARAIKAPTTVWTEGARDKLAIMVSEQAHYCIDRAARIMGLGTQGIIKVPTDAHFKIRTDLLEAYYQKAKEDGFFVFAIVGSCCSTSTGSHDDLQVIADFSEKHNLWFHADGAHGGAAIFSEKYRPILRGIERADSVVIDFHKMMLTPSLATALIYKKGQDSYHTFQQKAQYLWASTDEDWYSSGKRTFECTKAMIALKVYTLIRLYGEAVFEANVNTLYDLGKNFAQQIKARALFELAVEPECNIVCFRINDKSSRDLNVLNAQILQKIIEKGRFYLVQTTLRDTVYLRVSLMNPLTTHQDLTELLNTIEQELVVNHPSKSTLEQA
jgi:L-2,4-diaminobutyrate decarboxylase